MLQKYLTAFCGAKKVEKRAHFLKKQVTRVGIIGGMAITVIYHLKRVGPVQP